MGGWSIGDRRDRRCFSVSASVFVFVALCSVFGSADEHVSVLIVGFRFFSIPFFFVFPFSSVQPVPSLIAPCFASYLLYPLLFYVCMLANQRLCFTESWGDEIYYPS